MFLKSFVLNCSDCFVLSGRGLNDSPVGLAAYILEKFSTWTDHDFRNLEDGGLTRLGIGAKGRHFSHVELRLEQ